MNELRVVLASGKIIRNHVMTAVGYASASGFTVRFGLGADEAVERIEIDWPCGPRQEVQPPEVDRIVAIPEPSQVSDFVDATAWRDNLFPDADTATGLRASLGSLTAGGKAQAS